jgi:thiamine biosynthesis lipoprotein
VSHIVDPRTGQPTERIASASVFAPDCATADALSTAFSVLTPRESVALADSLPDVGCLLVERDGTITTNATWNARAIAPRHESSEESTDARYA